MVLYVSRDLATQSANISTVDPFTGFVETSVSTLPVNQLGDLMLDDLGQLYGFSVEPELTFGAFRQTDARAGHYIQIDPGTGVITDLGDDFILTYQDDGAGVPERSQIINNTPLGVGIQFQATTYDLNDGTGQILAIGHRGDYLNPPAGVDIGRNIVYLLSGATGNPVDNPGQPRIGGPATDAFEIGEILTQTLIRTVEATNFTVNATTNVANTQFLINDGLLFTVNDGFTTTTFEFESGPEVRLRDNATQNQKPQDGNFFILNDGIQDFIYQFNSGTAISVNTASAFGDGQTLTIQPTGGGAAITFEFENTVIGNGVTAGNIAINFDGTVNAIQMATNIAAAINAQPFATTAAVSGTQLFLTNDLAVATTATTGLTIQSDGDETPILHVTDPTLFADGQTFTIQVDSGTPITYEFEDTVGGVPGVAPGNVNIDFMPTQTAAQIAQTIGTRVQNTSETRTIRTTDKVVINGFNISVIDVSAAPGLTELFADLQINYDATATTDLIATQIATTVTNDPGSNFTASSDGGRINFQGAVGLVGLGTDFSATPTFLTNVGNFGVGAGNVAVPFFAADTANEIAQRIATALTATYGATINPAVFGGAVALEGVAGTGFSATANNPLTVEGEGPGGIITGVAAVGNEMYAVSDRGGLWRIDNARINPTPVYIGNSALDLLGFQFAGLTTGPQTVEGGAYANLLFGITSSGEVVAFNTSGELQPIFSNGATSIQTGLTSVTGLTFSNLDSNLWHTSPERGDTLNVPIDNSRLSTTGGQSFHFGTGPANPGDTTGLSGTYDFAGGAYGSIESERFSLAGYNPTDLPTLYFSYFLDTENSPNEDSFRVFAGGDDGEWHLLATNTAFGDSVADVQQAFDEDQWRQVRVSLAPFAGQENLRLRFDFSSAGSMNVGHLQTTGEELRAIDGYRIEDGDIFSIDGIDFEFERGFTINAPSGAAISAGESFMVEGQQFSFGAGAGVVIPFLATDTPAQIAAAIKTAVEANFIGILADIHSGHRVNLIGATSASESMVFTNFLVGDYGATAGVPVLIDSTMTDAQVADAIVDAMARELVFTQQITAVDGSQLVDNRTFSLNDGTQNVTFRFERGYTVRLNSGVGTALDGRTFTLTSPVDSQVYVFELNDFGAIDPTVSSGAIAIDTTGLTSNLDLSTAIRDAINAQGIAGITATYLGGRDVHIGTTDPASLVVGTGFNTGGTSINTTPGNVLIPYIPLATFTAQQVAGRIASAINGTTLNINATVSGRRINLSNTSNTLNTVIYNPSNANLDGHVGSTLIKHFKNVVRVIEHSVTNQGPLGLTTSLDGDSLGSFLEPGRARNNGFEGVYVDDLIIGFAERGEMVTGAVANNTFIANPDAPGLQVLEGTYQLEIRGGTDMALPNPPPLIPDPDAEPEPLLALTRSIDTNDRLTQGFTLLALPGSDLFDGQTFRLHDGLRGLTFEFDDLSAANLTPGVTPGNILIPFVPSDTAATIANRIRIAINTNFGPNFQIRASNISTGNRVDLFGNVGPESDIQFQNTTLIYNDFGDENRFRDQGQVLIRANYISNAAEFGIVSSAAPRNGSVLPHAGSVRNLSVLNPNNLAPGIVILNNVIYANGDGGIHFSGDTNPAGEPVGAVPFGRIVNNTIVGVGGTLFAGGGVGDTGILVDQNASPTLLNNIVANFETGVSIAGDSSSTRVSGTLYQGNITNAVGIQGSALGDLFISLGLTDPLFVDAVNANFYLAAGSQAIDSADDSFEDRPSLVSVKSPLGLGISNILAPDRDITGQLRVADLTVSPGGAAIKIDRGAIDRSDFDRPTAAVVQPLDNGPDDLNPAPTMIEVNDSSLGSFVIQFGDGSNGGTGINDATVVSDAVTITNGGTTLVPGFDYSFSYDANAGVLIITPLTGVWLPGQYVITLDNDDATDDGVDGIADGAGNFLAFNQPDGSVQFFIDVVEPTFWTNLIDPLDVNVDGSVTIIDAVLIINTLLDRGIRPLPDPPVSPDIPLPVSPGPGIGLVDVNRDGFVSVQDALFVINFLITGVRPPGTEPRSEFGGRSAASATPPADEPEGEPLAATASKSAVPAAAPSAVSSSDSTEFEDDVLEAGGYLYATETIVNSGGAMLGTKSPAPAAPANVDSVDAIYDEPDSLEDDDWMADLAGDDDDYFADDESDELDDVINELAVAPVSNSKEDA